jgi:hypothetical protein
MAKRGPLEAVGLVVPVLADELLDERVAQRDAHGLAARSSTE